MFQLLADIGLVTFGAFLVKAWPPADALATQLRDWIYGLLRDKPDDSDQAGA